MSDSFVCCEREWLEAAAGAIVWDTRQLHVELGDGRLRSVMFQVDGTEYVAAGDA